MGTATLTLAAVRVGISLMAIGLFASFVIPAWLRRNPMYLVGATECLG